MLSFARAEDAGDYKKAFAAAEQALGGSPRRLFHLAVPPSAAAAVVRTIDAAGLADAERTRVILEKPFGVDLESARTLNARLHEVLSEGQIFRIDHFLGKEGLQNILALRFANAFVEPVFNRDHVDSIQIDVPEQLTIVGRAGFYEQTGCLKDMVTTHLLQVLGFVAMEPPVSLRARCAARPHRRRVRVAAADRSRARRLRPVRGLSRRAGRRAGLDRRDVRRRPRRDRLVALGGRADLPAHRKAMAVSRETVTVVFKEPPMRLFARARTCATPATRCASSSTIRPGSRSSSSASGPGRSSPWRSRSSTSSVRRRGAHKLLAPYERLFHDALIGDQTLFTRADGVERIWEVAAPLLAAPPAPQPYAQGSWGPPRPPNGSRAPRLGALVDARMTRRVGSVIARSVSGSSSMRAA